MIINLNAIRLENFGSFRNQQWFILPSRPGLYHMQGVNQVDSRLTGNGAGKSTIWKGMFWALFDQTPDGLKAGDVCNWEVDKGSHVTLDFVDFTPSSPVIWSMKRHWKPNSWTLSHAAEFITDEEVIDLAKGYPNWLKDQLPTSPDLFLNCILMAQEAPTFLDLKPEAQASLFGEVLNLDHWIDLSKKASAKANEQDQRNRSMEAQVARLEGAATEIPDYKAKINEWEQRQDQRLEEVRITYERLVREYDALKIKKVDVGSASLRRQHRGQEELVASLIARERALVAEAGELKAKVTAELDAIEMIEERARILSEPECPTCGAPVDQETRERLATDEHSKRSKVVTFLEAEARKVKAELDDLDKQIVKAQNEAKDLEARVRDADQARTNHERQLTDLSRRLDQLEDEHEALRTEPNPWKAAQKEALGRARINQEALFEARAGLDKGYELFSLYSFWIKGFKELRLYHIGQALHELELEVNNALVELGLPGWEILFEVDRENAKGGVRRGFSVRVVTPHTSRAVPWRAWSGGEKQRLRIAASMGMANMIRNRRPPTIPLEVWDEPTKGMSPQGVQDLMVALERRARIEQRVIIVVDHTLPDFGGFAGKAVITKTENGSQIETDW